MYYILSKNNVTDLVLQPAKIDKDGNPSQEAIRVKFEDGFYRTDSEEILARFKKLRNWGTEYSLVDEPPAKAAAKPGITVTGMDDPETKKEQRLVGLEMKLDQVVNAVGELAKLVAASQPKAKKPEKEEKEDKAESK